MTPEDFESLLIAQLGLLGLPVMAYPSDPKNYFPEHDPGEVLVRYEGRKPTRQDLTGAISQEMVFFFEIVVATRQVREEDGAYDWLQKIFSHLEGYTLAGATGQLHMEVESFMDEKDGLWQFGQKWSLKTMVAQETNDENMLNYLEA